MPYQIKFTTTSANLIRNFHPEIKKITNNSLKEIAKNPYLGKEFQEDLDGYLSYRFKRYRIVYTVDEEVKTITVHLVWHRKNVYELLAKLLPESN